jgi:hypothetical protein
MTMPNVLRETLELLQMSHERSLAMAKARLALAMQYNPQTILHWCAGRRPIGPRAERELVALRNQLQKERAEYVIDQTQLRKINDAD